MWRSRPGNNQVKVYQGNGSMTLGVVTSFSSAGGSAQPYGLATADFDGDGKLDLVASNSGTGSQGMTF